MIPLYPGTCERARASGPRASAGEGLAHAGFAVVPMTGHTVNIEEPGLFNQLVAEFLTSVES